MTDQIVELARQTAIQHYLEDRYDAEPPDWLEELHAFIYSRAYKDEWALRERNDETGDFNGH